MATAGDIITASFLKVGVDVPTTAQTASALISLNNMISLLGADLLNYSVVSESFSMVVNDAEYTIGSSGQWDTVRPTKLISCFLRDDDDYDYPLKVMSASEYNQMTSKQWIGRPEGVYFLPEYPLAKIIFNAIPDYAFDAYLECEKNFTEFTATTTSVTLPPEYKEALVYNLAVSLGEDWDRVVSKTLYAQAQRTREVIDRLNASNRVPGRAKFDMAGVGGVNVGYNVVTDEVIDGGAF